MFGISRSRMRAFAAGCVKRAAFGTFAGALSLAALAPAQAQYVDCERLRAQLASLGSGGGDSGRYAAAAQKQRSELNRTVGYARSIGCDRSRFLIFGDDPPPQCGTINAQIGRMQANLASLEQRSGGGGGDARRRSLTAQYDAYCRGQAQPQRERGFLESLFGPSSDRLEQIPIEGPDGGPGAAEDDRPRGGGQAVCVRKCDGAFFPLPISARRGNSDSLKELCSALCPNAETAVYRRVSTNDIDTAVGLDGEAYSSLPNAKKFEKTYDKTCSCKTPEQSWVEALAQAEKILTEEAGKKDAILTPEKAAELSQPKDVRQDARRKRRQEAQRKVDDALSAQEGMTGSLAPTAGKESAGIGSTPAGTPVLGPDQGAERNMPGPDGATRRVRIIGPTL